MDLFSLFKKDYFNYLLSIILPAIISGLSIPIFKHLLGAEGYGYFSIWLNAVLISTAVLSAWITQSIIRYYPMSANKLSFSKKAIRLSVITQLLFLLPSFIIAWTVSKDPFLSLLCSLLLFAISIQFTLLPIIQSGFLSKKIIWSELIRIGSYVLLAVILLKLSGIKYIYALLTSVLISYVFSLLYLIRQMHTHIDNETKGDGEQAAVFKDFIKFGAPFSLWFIFSYLLSYIDKLYTLKNCGGEAQGNYQAIFDLLYKSITLIISPAITSLYPILTAAYTRGDRAEIKKFLMKIIGYEIVGFLLVSLGYWFFGANILLSILKIPQTLTYKWIGFIVIAGAFVWQFAILIQKKYELKMKSRFLLIMVFVALIVQLVFYSVFNTFNHQLLYPLGFLLSAVVYLLLISASSIVEFLGFNNKKQVGQ
jgi:O-antigen/teichoic acid export membrane protein